MDLGHLSYVHGYENTKLVGSVTVDGAYLKSCFDFTRVRRILGVKDLVHDVSAVTHIYGLGYSFVEIHEKTIDMHARLWVLVTPIDGTLVDLVLVGQVREIRQPRRFISGLGFIPLKWRQRLLNHILLSQQKRDVMQDVVIWERKRYRTPPRLCRADGPIGTWRRYCRQFYPELEAETGRPPELTGGLPPVQSEGTEYEIRENYSFCLHNDVAISYLIPEWNMSLRSPRVRWTSPWRPARLDQPSLTLTATPTGDELLIHAVEIAGNNRYITHRLGLTHRPPGGSTQ